MSVESSGKIDPAGDATTLRQFAKAVTVRGVQKPKYSALLGNLEAMFRTTWELRSGLLFKSLLRGVTCP
eukprot:4187969-Pleurochrysis_carterae.AAC.1